MFGDASYIILNQINNKVNSRDKAPAKNGVLMIEMWNLALTNSFCSLTLLKESFGFVPFCARASDILFQSLVGNNFFFLLFHLLHLVHSQ